MDSLLNLICRKAGVDVESNNNSFVEFSRYSNAAVYTELSFEWIICLKEFFQSTWQFESSQERVDEIESLYQAFTKSEPSLSQLDPRFITRHCGPINSLIGLILHVDHYNTEDEEETFDPGFWKPFAASIRIMGKKGIDPSFAWRMDWHHRGFPRSRNCPLTEITKKIERAQSRSLRKLHNQFSRDILDVISCPLLILMGHCAWEGYKSTFRKRIKVLTFRIENNTKIDLALELNQSGTAIKRIAAKMEHPAAALSFKQKDPNVGIRIDLVCSWMLQLIKRPTDLTSYREKLSHSSAGKFVTTHLHVLWALRRIERERGFIIKASEMQDYFLDWLEGRVIQKPLDQFFSQDVSVIEMAGSIITARSKENQAKKRAGDRSLSIWRRQLNQKGQLNGSSSKGSITTSSVKTSTHQNTQLGSRDVSAGGNSTKNTLLIQNQNPSSNVEAESDVGDIQAENDVGDIHAEDGVDDIRAENGIGGVGVIKAEDPSSKGRVNKSSTSVKFGDFGDEMKNFITGTMDYHLGTDNSQSKDLDAIWLSDDDLEDDLQITMEVICLCDDDSAAESDDDEIVPNITSRMFSSTGEAEDSFIKTEESEMKIKIEGSDEIPNLALKITSNTSETAKTSIKAEESEMKIQEDCGDHIPDFDSKMFSSTAKIENTPIEAKESESRMEIEGDASENGSNAADTKKRGEASPQYHGRSKRQRTSLLPNTSDKAGDTRLGSPSPTSMDVAQPLSIDLTEIDPLLLSNQLSTAQSSLKELEAVNQPASLNSSASNRSLSENFGAVSQPSSPTSLTNDQPSLNNQDEQEGSDGPADNLPEPSPHIVTPKPKHRRRKQKTKSSQAKASEDDYCAPVHKHFRRQTTENSMYATLKPNPQAPLGTIPRPKQKKFNRTEERLRENETKTKEELESGAIFTFYVDHRKNWVVTLRGIKVFLPYLDEDLSYITAFDMLNARVKVDHKQSGPHEQPVLSNLREEDSAWGMGIQCTYDVLKEGSESIQRVLWETGSSKPTHQMRCKMNSLADVTKGISAIDTAKLPHRYLFNKNYLKGVYDGDRYTACSDSSCADCAQIHPKYLIHLE